MKMARPRRRPGSSPPPALVGPTAAGSGGRAPSPSWGQIGTVVATCLAKGRPRRQPGVRLCQRQWLLHLWGEAEWLCRMLGRERYARATPPAGQFASVSAGYRHTCGVKRDGSVGCWSSNKNVFGAVIGQATPPAGVFVSVSAGGQHSCGVRRNGSVVCWGSDSIPIPAR